MNATRTPEAQRRVVEGLLEQWERCPDLPLGRLLAEACASVEDQDLELCDDSVLVEQLRFRVEHGRPKPFELKRPLAHMPPSTSE